MKYVLLAICIVLLVISLVLSFLFLFKELLLKYYIMAKRNRTLLRNKNLYSIIDKLDLKTICKKSIPSELKSYCFIFKIHGFDRIYSEATNRTGRYIVEKVLQSFQEQVQNAPFPFPLFEPRNNEETNVQSTISVVDYLDFKSGYFPSIHTDIEWGLLNSTGTHFWVLVENENHASSGNIVLVYNSYLYEKYYRQPICIQLIEGSDTIGIFSNTYFPFNQTLLECIDIEDFIAQSKRYYVAIAPGECLVFRHNVLHMSDHRDILNRHAVNFRVVNKRVRWNMWLSNLYHYNVNSGMIE